MILTARQAVHTWYLLSCSHTARQLWNARGNTTDCVQCLMEHQWHRVFILQTVYEKPYDD